MDFWPSSVDDFQILRGLVNKLFRREYRKWRDSARSVETAPLDPEDSGSALEQLLFPTFSTPSPTTRQIDVGAASVSSGFHIIAIMMRSFEIRDSWIEVLLEDDVRDRQPLFPL